MSRRPNTAFRTLLAVFLVLAAMITAVWAAQPTAYNPATDFSDFSAANPDTPQSGTSLDAEFNALKLTTDDILENLELLQRDDGELANGVVGNEQLDADLAASLGAAVVWTTATAYAADDLVFHNNGIYECATAHTSGTFATDLAAGKWTAIIDYSSAVLSSTSTTSLAIGTGAKTFTVQSGKYYSAGDYVLVVSSGNPAVDYMFGTVTSYSGTTLIIDAAVTGGSGTHTDWVIRVSGPRGAQGATGSLDISALSAETTVDTTNDYMLMLDASEAGGTNNKLTFQTLFNSFKNMTAITAPANDDSILMFDSSGALAGPMTTANFYKTIATLTQDTSPDGVNDLVPTYDASASGGKYVALNDIYKTINSLSTDSSPDVTADYIPTYDASASGAKKVLFSALLAGISGLTTDTSPDSAADYVATYDASASAAKKVLISNLVSNVSGSLAGVQFFTASGTWTRETGATKALVFVVGGGGGGGGAGNSAVNGSAGGSSSFGAHCSATGGSGGTGADYDSASNVSAGGAGGVGSSGSLNLKGSGGGWSKIEISTAGVAASTNSRILGGEGGSSVFGGGAVAPGVQAASASSAGNAGGSYGGGGSGAVASEANALDGTASGNGGGGGGGGGTCIKWITSPGSTETVTIGAAGAGGAGSLVTGGAGAGGMIMVLSFI